jgi:hypothetical protein
MSAGAARGLLGALALALAAGHAHAACPGEAQGFRRLSSPEAEVALRWEPAEIKVAQFFAVEVVACRAAGPEPVSRIAIDASMPAHGHGMNYRPSVSSPQPGRYRFSGLMLHMAGRWQVTIDLFQGGRRTRLTHEVNLAP